MQQKPATTNSHRQEKKTRQTGATRALGEQRMYTRVHERGEIENGTRSREGKQQADKLGAGSGDVAITTRHSTANVKRIERKSRNEAHSTHPVFTQTNRQTQLHEREPTKTSRKLHARKRGPDPCDPVVLKQGIAVTATANAERARQEQNKAQPEGKHSVKRRGEAAVHSPQGGSQRKKLAELQWDEN